MRYALLALPFALLPLHAAQAANHEHSHAHAHEEHASLDAHEHGVASLNVALDGQTLEIQLQSPAMNLVGFEHEAKSDADKAKVASEITKLAEDNDSLRAQLEEMRQIVLEMQGKEDKPKNKRRAAEPAEEVAT